MVRRRDPFGIKPVATWLAARLGGGGSSFAFWEHAVACAVSLALTLGFNLAAIALCAAFSAAMFPTSAKHEADLLTYGDLGLVTSNNNSFSASYGDVVAAASLEACPTRASDATAAVPVPRVLAWVQARACLRLVISAFL